MIGEGMCCELQFIMMEVSIIKDMEFHSIKIYFWMGN